MPQYCGVVVETPLTQVFHYRLPEGAAREARPGDRVLAPFGRRRLRGVITETADECPIDPARVKEVLSVSPAEDRVPPEVMALTRWVADYYRTGWGMALAAAIPASVRTEKHAATRRDALLLVTPDEAEEKASRLARAPRQAAVLRLLAARARAAGQARPVPVADLALEAGADGAAMRPLADRGLVALSVREYARGLPEDFDDRRPAPEPTPEQAEALRALEAALEAQQFHAFLLHGVTGSGKTEVYLRALSRTLEMGRTVLALVPEISLTPQAVGRFRSRSAAPVAVLHSHMADGERAAEWRRIARGEARVVVGARSAVFAPLPRLGLVVVDEEHERSYKQDNDPRYHGRDVAVARAHQAGAVALLGSATPSLESWANARRGKYRLLRLPTRPGGASPARTLLVDLRREWAEVKKPAALSRDLERALSGCLSRREQAILFLNRRGFHTAARCAACGDVVQCPDCDIPLTYHRGSHRLRCHYCGGESEPPGLCPACSAPALRYEGTGVERIEDILGRLLPEARILRMDADTMQAAGAHAEALARFGRGEADILLGTQMVAKGLDFPNVTLVGVLQADSALTLPEFRAAERTFQLVTQVIGRAGRADKPGLAVVQAFQPEHHAIRHAMAQDFGAFAREELRDREGLGYPPFGRLARVVFRGEDEAATAAAATAAREALGEAPGPGGHGTALGPAPCFLARVQKEFRYHLLLKATGPAALAGWLDRAGLASGEKGGVRRAVDVDPVSLL